jgi:hypothetical protein
MTKERAVVTVEDSFHGLHRLRKNSGFGVKLAERIPQGLNRLQKNSVLLKGTGFSPYVSC